MEDSTAEDDDGDHEDAVNPIVLNSHFDQCSTQRDIVVPALLLFVPTTRQLPHNRLKGHTTKHSL